jgi:hypothetical protein
MAWEKRGGGKRKYFYRSIRRDGRVKKLYYGNGPIGEIAAGNDALRRAEREAAERAAQVIRDRLNAAVTLTQELCRVGALLAAATLLVAGYHRPSRHGWRTWRHGRRIMQATH